MKTDIKHVEVALDLAFTTFWIALVLRWDSFLAWLDSVGFPLGIPIPSAEIVAQFRGWLIAVALIGIAVSVIKLTQRRWNVPITAGYTLHQLLNGYVTIAMLNAPNLLRPGTFTVWASWGEASVAETQATVAGIAALIGVLTAIGIAADVVTRWVAVARHQPDA